MELDIKKIKISLSDFIGLLESMRDENNTQDIVIFEYKGLPALCDADDMENIITFQTTSSEEDADQLSFDFDDDENVH